MCLDLVSLSRDEHLSLHWNCLVPVGEGGCAQYDRASLVLLRTSVEGPMSLRHSLDFLIRTLKST
jgi:hypothetical protein